MVIDVNRKQRRTTRGMRRSRAAHAFEERAEEREGVTQPADYYADHWFDHSEPPKAFLDREQSRADSCRPATKRPAETKPVLSGDGFKACGHKVAQLETLLKVDRFGLARLLQLPMKYLAQVVAGGHSLHKLRAAARERLGLDIDALPATYAPHARQTMECSNSKKRDGENGLE